MKRKNQMVDVSKKRITLREARAACRVMMSPQTLKKIDKSPKGDVFAAARLAGILAAKQTSFLIPMCHPVSLTSVAVDLETDSREGQIRVSSTVRGQARTGFEMEALLAVSVAALTVYDMMKWADKKIVISETKLFFKSGGKSGAFKQ